LIFIASCFVNARVAIRICASEAYLVSPPWRRGLRGLVGKLLIKRYFRFETFLNPPAPPFTKGDWFLRRAGIDIYSKLFC
jgi:hypothetical protein